VVKIRNLPLERFERRLLRRNEIRTSDDLWRAVGSEFQVGLARVSETTHVQRDSLLRALVAAADKEPRRQSATGKATMLGLLGLILAVLAGLRLVEVLGMLRFPLPGSAAHVDQVVVASEAGLAAFHLLASSDLRLAPRAPTALGFTRTQDALGRYLLRPVAQGALLRNTDVSTTRLPPSAFAGRWIATLRVDQATLGPQIQPGLDALLILAAKDSPARPAIETSALVLDIKRGASSAAVTLAIASERRSEVMAALGSSTVFLAQGAPLGSQTAAPPPSRAPRTLSTLQPAARGMPPSATGPCAHCKAR
jgi:hypothetical protein